MRSFSERLCKNIRLRRKHFFQCAHSWNFKRGGGRVRFITQCHRPGGFFGLFQNNNDRMEFLYLLQKLFRNRIPKRIQHHAGHILIQLGSGTQNHQTAN